MLGLAYKKNIDDTRESPAVEIMDLLQAKGANVEYSDPHVPVFPIKRNYYFDLRSISLNEESVASYDCVLLATDHDGFDYSLLERNAKIFVDTRGRLKSSRNIILA